MKRSERIISYALYSLIALFWFGLIIGLLYLPRASQIMPSKPTINILAWGGIFDNAILTKFTAETGIKVNLSFYSTNEELLVYLKATRGRGYDIVCPSDYAVKKLRSEGLIKKIDNSKLNFLPTLNPNFMGYDFDVYNEYSLPLMVEFFGLGYDKTFFKEPPVPSWDLIFKPQGFKIIMVNDPVEAAMLAAHYLYKSIPHEISEDQLKEIKELLIGQRQWIEAYSDFRPDYFLLTKNCPLVVTAYSSYLKALEQAPSEVGFLIPHDGIFMSIENIALSAASDHDDAVYEFINYVYTQEVMKHHFKTRASIPATLNVLQDLPIEEEIYNLITMPRDEFVKKILFFDRIMPEKTLHELWIAVKSR